MIARIVTAATRRGGYMAMMGIGAVLGILRGFVLAGILPASGFGLYAAIVAVGLFLAPLIGLGQIEDMRKRFPRLWVEGRIREIGPISSRLLSIMAARAGIIVLVGGAGLLVIGQSDWAIAVFAGGLIAFSQSGAAIMASALRAGPDLTPMATAALIRGSAALLLAVAGALAFGLNGAIMGEAVGGFIGLLAAKGLFARQVRRLTTSGNIQPPSQNFEDAGQNTGQAEKRLSKTGLQLLFGTMAASVPIYLSRPFVGLQYSLQELGTFAFLMLFVQAVVTAISITDQIIGPTLIRMRHAGASLAHQLKIMWLYVGGMAALIAAGLAIAFVLLTQTFLNGYAAKYELSLPLMLPIGVFAMFQVALSLDWMLMAHDRERLVLNTSLTYLAAFLAGALVVFATGLPLVTFLWIMAAARILQFLLQVSYVVALPREGTVSGSTSG